MQSYGVSSSVATQTTILGDHPPILKNVTLASNGTAFDMLKGTVLGQTLNASVSVGAGNTGNGVMGEVTLGAAAVAEVLTLICTAEVSDKGTFSVTGSKTGKHADLTVATAYNNGLVSMTLADGAEDFDADDTFTIQVTASGSYCGVNPDGTDGSQTAHAVLLEDVSVPASGGEKAVAVVHGLVISTNLVWTHDGITDAEKAVALANLELVGVYNQAEG